MPKKWEHLEFYIIPNLYDITNNNISDFPKFSIILETAMKKLFDKYFVKNITIDEIDFKVMDKAWEQNKIILYQCYRSDSFQREFYQNQKIDETLLMLLIHA